MKKKIVSLQIQTLELIILKYPSRVNEIPKDKDIVIYCGSGARSAMVANYLKVSANHTDKGNLQSIREVFIYGHLRSILVSLGINNGIICLSMLFNCGIKYNLKSFPI